MRKHIDTFNENMKVVNKSSLDGWSGKTISPTKRKEIQKKLDKITNMPMVKDIRSVLADNNLGVLSVNQGDYTKKNGIILPNEVGTEYRLELGKLLTKEEVEDSYFYTDEEGNGKIDTDHEDYIEDSKLIGTVVEIPYALEYSFFSDYYPMEVLSNFPTTIEDVGLLSGTMYLKNLVHCYPDVTEGRLDYTTAIRDIEEVKCLLNQFRIKIDNNNIEIIQNIILRLYKDSKFFAELDRHLGSNKLKNMIKDLNRVIK